MAHIIIMGAGIGGVSMAYELRAALPKQHRITVVSDSPTFHFVPSNPWVAVNWRKPDAIKVPLKECLGRKGIEFSAAGVKRVHPADNRLELGDGGELRYDYLVIATGPRLAFEEIEGLGPIQGHTESICHVDHAVRAAEKWQRFVDEPGPMVVGAAQLASCFGPAYEYAFIADADLRKRRIRDRVPMTFVTSEPYIGHLGLAGVGNSKGVLEDALRERHINWITNARIDRVEEGRMHVTELDEEGNEKKRHELPFSYSMVLPAFTGVDAVCGIEGLVNPRGFVLIDQHQRNPAFPNIYAVGVCVAIPPIEPTPVPVGVPKTGYMIESMVCATVNNLQAELEGREPHHVPTWSAVCLADLGDTGVAFVAIPQIPPRNVTWTRQGKWVHLAKIGFEKYFLRKVKKGSTDPIYERSILKMLGIEKIKMCKTD
ncbi:MAG: NAD(P)/FAD-dependent oxidoreductase [Gammaproteobacteria bacterium]|nr:MAG: NAD(P)/FAD-dependent oxidoreductase [Gammaproteobacteria bacterium]